MCCTGHCISKRILQKSECRDQHSERRGKILQGPWHMWPPGNWKWEAAIRGTPCAGDHPAAGGIPHTVQNNFDNMVRWHQGKGCPGQVPFLYPHSWVHSRLIKDLKKKKPLTWKLIRLERLDENSSVQINVYILPNGIERLHWKIVSNLPSNWLQTNRANYNFKITGLTASLRKQILKKLKFIKQKRKYFFKQYIVEVVPEVVKANNLAFGSAYGNQEYS